jgi:subtilisin family serine protease
MTYVESDDDHDRIGHGTGCADLVLQVAPEARIIPIRVFGTRLETAPAAVIAAIDWAVAERIPIINLSLYTFRTDFLAALYRSCELARRAGSIVVAAEGKGRGVESFPSAFEPVIGVRAGTLEDRFGIDVAGEEGLDFKANGIHQARGLGGAERKFGGSSFAAPVVTGHIARILERHPDASLGEVREGLREVSLQSA